MRFDNVTYEASYGTFKQLPKSTQPEVCFSGRSNVGKSSLINKILNRKQLARVSSQPGKTITINFYKVSFVIKNNVTLVCCHECPTRHHNRKEKQYGQ